MKITVNTALNPRLTVIIKHTSQQKTEIITNLVLQWHYWSPAPTSLSTWATWWSCWSFVFWSHVTGHCRHCLACYRSSRWIHGAARLVEWVSVTTAGNLPDLLQLVLLRLALCQIYCIILTSSLSCLTLLITWIRIHFLNTPAVSLIKNF